MSISTPFIKRPIATSLVMAALVLIGIAAYPLLPVAPLPRVDFPTIVVRANYLARVLKPWRPPWRSRWRRRSRKSPASSQLTSTSVLGITSVTVQFDLDRNIDGAAGDIQAAIKAASGAVADEHAGAADLPEGQPVRRADHDPGGAVRRDAADRRSTTTRTTCCRSRSRRSPAWRRC